MFITRSTRHDRADLQELYDSLDWSDVALDDGVAFIARDGKVIGAALFVEVAPQVVVVDGVVVREDRRREGIATQILQAGMNSRGGKLYLCCEEQYLKLYEGLGFTELPEDELPDPVRAYLEKVGDIPPPPDPPHHFMTAR